MAISCQKTVTRLSIILPNVVPNRYTLVGPNAATRLPISTLLIQVPNNSAVSRVEKPKKTYFMMILANHSVASVSAHARVFG